MMRSDSPPLRFLSLFLSLFLLSPFASETQGQETALYERKDRLAEPSQGTSEVQWRPEATHPCTILRMTTSEFKQLFPRGLIPLYPHPLVIVADNKERNAYFRHLTESDRILEFFPPNFSVTLSSSNSFSEHRRTIPFAQYLDEILATKETLPGQLSNETWYLFGETYSEEWKKLLNHYQLPECIACTDRDLVALSFGIGNRGSGVQWHIHGPGFSEAVHGRKHWVLYKDKPEFHKDQTSRNWMEYNYVAMDPDERPYECTLEPGDLVYFPDMYWHATINLDPFTAFVSTFTQEHLFVNDEDRQGFR